MSMNAAVSATTPRRHEMAVMGREGDTKITWDVDSEAEVENARRSFDYFRSQKYVAFRVEGEDGARGEMMAEFDPRAQQVIFVPPMQGGLMVMLDLETNTVAATLSTNVLTFTASATMVSATTAGTVTVGISDMPTYVLSGYTVTATSATTAVPAVLPVGPMVVRAIPAEATTVLSTTLSTTITTGTHVYVPQGNRALIFSTAQVAGVTEMDLLGMVDVGDGGFPWADEIGTPVLNLRGIARLSHRVMTDEERAAYARREAEAEERRKVYEAERAEARGRAEKLLRGTLSAKQNADLTAHNYFDVAGQDGNLYRINRGRSNNVKKIDPASGKVLRSYCIYPRNYEVPDADTMLAQKLMLEADLATFLKVANQS